MSILSKLKLSDTTRAEANKPSIERKRGKLVENIEHQIKAAEAEDKGELYTYPALRWVTHPETGERTRQSVAVKVKPWWWRDAQGNYFLGVKYGNKKLELAKGKAAIEVGERQSLVPTLKQIADAVNAGELDTLINGAAKFGKNTK